MGSRGSVSKSRRSRALTQIQNQLVTNGHISLNVDDYKNVEGSVVRDLFASLDYEVNAIFNERDEVISIQSQFKIDEVSVKLSKDRVAMRKDGGKRFMDFHNHPLERDSIQIFSPEDIRAYAGTVSKKGNTNAVFPTEFMVQTQSGSKFILSYDGKKANKLTRTGNFAKRYTSEFNKVAKRSSNPNQATRNMLKWLQDNAPKYGFEITEALFIPSKR